MTMTTTGKVTAALLGAAMLTGMLTGCVGDLEKAVIASSSACASAKALFSPAETELAEQSAPLRELAESVPASLRADAELLAAAAESATPEGASNPADGAADFAEPLVRLQAWAVQECGASVTYPAAGAASEEAEGAPALADYLMTRGESEGTVVITVFGAKTPDAAVALCTQALAGESAPITVAVVDDIGVTLAATQKDGRCANALG